MSDYDPDLQEDITKLANMLDSEPEKLSEYREALVATANIVFEAVCKDEVDVLEAVYEKQPEFPTDIVITKDFTPLIIAAREGASKCVDFLIKQGCSVDARTHNLNTAIFFAASRNHVKILSSLIAGGASVNIYNVNGDTPLMWACLAGSVETVSLLLPVLGAQSVFVENDVSVVC